MSDDIRERESRDGQPGTPKSATSSPDIPSFSWRPFLTKYIAPTAFASTLVRCI